jgi:hypothetical protein
MSLQPLPLGIVAGAALFCSVAVAQDDPCRDGLVRRHGEIAVTNNVWNRDGVAGTQCLTANGWTWNWPDIGDGRVRSFPSLYTGKQPWAPGRATNGFPRQIGALQKLSAKVDLQVKSSGVGNTTFDIWIIEDPQKTGRANIRAELMIWLDGNLPPFGTSQGIFTVDGRRYELFLNPGEWTYAAFLPVTPDTTVTVSVPAFLELLEEQGLVSESWYIGSVELGNEVVSGTGQTVVRQFELDVR